MPRRRPRTRWPRLAGVALTLAGLGFLGYVAWQYWGTTWTARAEQDRIVEQLERSWAARPPAPPRPHSARPTPAVDHGRDGGATGPRDDTRDAPGPTTVEAGGTVAGAILRIPAFGSSYAVPILEGTTTEALSVGVGHFSDSAAVGEVGNYALAAHRVTHGEPFRRLPELEAGDLVVVDTARWRYTYALDTAGDGLEVAFTETWVLDALPRNPAGGVQPSQRAGQRLLTLTTCAELFHTDDRLVAFGHLVDRSPRG